MKDLGFFLLQNISNDKATAYPQSDENQLLLECANSTSNCYE